MEIVSCHVPGLLLAVDLALKAGSLLLNAGKFIFTKKVINSALKTLTHSKLYQENDKLKKRMEDLVLSHKKVENDLYSFRDSQYSFNLLVKKKFNNLTTEVNYISREVELMRRHHQSLTEYIEAQTVLQHVTLEANKANTFVVRLMHSLLLAAEGDLMSIKNQ